MHGPRFGEKNMRHRISTPIPYRQIAFTLALVLVVVRCSWLSVGGGARADTNDAMNRVSDPANLLMMNMPDDGGCSPEDCNKDGAVDAFDLWILRHDLQRGDGMGCNADGSGIVNIFDMFATRNGYRTRQPAAMVIVRPPRLGPPIPSGKVPALRVRPRLSKQPRRE